MTQYRAGQTVEVVTGKDWSEGFQNGNRITLERLIPSREAFAGEWEVRAANGVAGIISEKNFRSLPTGPVVTETVTKTRIVPGVWDSVWVSYEHDERLTVQYMIEKPSADQLDAAAAVLSALAKGLRDVD